MGIKLYDLHQVEQVHYPGDNNISTEDGNQAIAVILWEMLPAASTDAFAAFIAGQVGVTDDAVHMAIEKWYDAHKGS